MPSELPSSAKRNVDTIAQVEQQLLMRRPHVERLGERIAGFFGSLPFGSGVRPKSRLRW